MASGRRSQQFSAEEVACLVVAEPLNSDDSGLEELLTVEELKEDGV